MLVYLPYIVNYTAIVCYKYGGKFADYKDKKIQNELRQSVNSCWVLTDSSHIFTHQYFHIIRRKHVRPLHCGVKALRKPNNRYTKCLKFLLQICTHRVVTAKMRSPPYQHYIWRLCIHWSVISARVARWYSQKLLTSIQSYMSDYRY